LRKNTFPGGRRRISGDPVKRENGWRRIERKNQKEWSRKQTLGESRYVLEGERPQGRKIRRNLRWESNLKNWADEEESQGRAREEMGNLHKGGEL